MRPCVEKVLTDTRPQFGWWHSMWVVAKLGFFVWVLRQLLRYAIFHWMTKLRRTVDSYSRANTIVSSTNHQVRVRPSVSNVTNVAERNSASGATTDRR